MNAIKKIYLRDLSNGGFETFLKLVQSKAVEDENISTKCEDILAMYATVMGVLDDALIRSRKEAYSDEISELNNRRQSVYRQLRSNVKSMRNYQNPELSGAAKRLWQLLLDYKLGNRVRLYRTTSIIHNLLQELTGQYAEDVKKLDLKLIVDTLKDNNDRLFALVGDRGDEESKRVVGEMAAARKDCTEVYQLLVDRVNALAVVEGDEKYNSFIDFVNYNILNFKRYELYTPTRATEATPDDPLGPDGPELDEVEKPDTVPTLKLFKAEFVYNDGETVKIWGESGEPLVAPENTKGYCWEPAVPALMPAENTTYREVLEKQEAELVTKYFVSFRVDDSVLAIQGYHEGDRIVPPECPEGYHWPDDMLIVMPAHNMIVNAVKDE